MPDFGGYGGQVAYIPLGAEGLNYNKNPSRIPPGGLLQAESITYADDSVHKSPGRSKLGAYSGLGSTTVFSLYDWHPNEGTQYLVTLSSIGRIYIAPAGNPVLNQNQTIPTGASTPPRAIFVPCGGSAAITTASPGRMLAVFTGVGAPGFYQGTSVVPQKFTTVPTDWSGGNQPVSGAVHNGRLFAWGVASKPHSLYGSTIDDHRDFRTGVETGNSSASSATYLHCHPGLGLRTYCGYSHKGILFLLKYPNGVFFLDDTDLNPTGWGCKIVTDAMGCAPTPFAGILVDDGILFLSATGQFFLITATTQGGITVTDLSTRMNLDQWLQANINMTRLAQAVSVWDPTLKQAHFALPSKRNGSSSTTNDLLLTFDFRSFTKGEAKVRFAYSYRDPVQGIALRRNPTTYVYEPIVSDYSGNVWLLAQDDRSINAALPGATPSLTGYQAVFQTSHTDLQDYSSDPTLGVANKNFDHLWIEYIPNTGGSITVTPYVDGVAQDAQTVDLSASGPRLASSPGNTEFTLYSGSGSTTASELAGVGTSGLDLRVKGVRITGTGRRVSFQIQSSSTASEDMNITGLYVGYRKAGNDVGRGQGSS
jgi:hypothetical protein